MSNLTRFLLSFLFLATLSPILTGQGVTSSGMGGKVTFANGEPADDVQVVAVHEPTGTTFRTQTNNGGLYRILGMRVGGPYTISYTSETGATARRTDIFMNLQQERTLNIRLSSDEEPVFELEAFEVVSNELSVVFNESKQGSGSVITSKDINLLPTVSRSLNDIVRLDPRVSVYDRDNGTISAGGKNFRYNTLLIDGVPTNDSFGLSDSGLPALKQPFSLESIAEISVQISPYTLENAGFTGAAISAVTKSGTNEFHGSAFGFYRNTDMVGELYDSYIEPGEEEPELVPFQDFVEFTIGATLGGPIIKDKLFFFALYEKVEETVTRDPGDFFPVPDELDRLLYMINEVYRFDPGSLEDPGDQRRKDDKYLLKLDWNISSRHRLSARYQLTEGVEPNYPGYSGDNQIAFSSHFYDRVVKLDDYTAEIFSNWAPSFQTEFLFSFKQYSDERVTPDPQLPEVQISSVDGIEGEPGTVWLGTDGFSQANSLNVDTTVMRFKATWLLGDHQLKFGVQYENFENTNEFIPNFYGNWFFRNGVGSFQNAVNPGALETYSIQLPAEGSTGIADWSMAIASAYIEDNWIISSRFNLNAGIRIDYPTMSDRPPRARGSVEDEARSFEEIFGEPNTVNVDGNYVIQPRVGFNYAFDEDRTVQVRGGAGLFFGTAPHVWISSIFVNNGVTQEFFRASTTRTPAFSPDPFNPPVPTAVNSRVNVDYLNEDFKMPTEWKANIAIDHKLFANIAFTMEAAFSWTQYDIHYIHNNLKQQPASFFSTGFLPDGRKIFANEEAYELEPGYRNVIKLTNTREGYGRQFTALLQRPVDTWGFRAGYTYTEAQNINDGQSASAASNWLDNVAFNPNDEVLGRSRYETRHRFIVSGTYVLEWGERQHTSFTLVYEGRSGRPFSYVFGRDLFSIDMNRDGNASNDLLYVPTGIDDPLVAWVDQRDSGKNTAGVEFMEFIDNTPGLAEYRGQVVPRNTGQSPWIHQFDLNITHEIKTWGNQRLELIVAIENLGNLINDEWGRERRVRGPNGNVPVVFASTTPERFAPEGKGTPDGVYIYRPSEADYNGDNWYEVRNFSSRWAANVGFRYTF